MDLFPDHDAVTQQIRAYMDAVKAGGAEALLKRPPKTEASLDALWEPEEAEARGESDSYQAGLAEERAEAEAIPLKERRKFYQIELDAIWAYMGCDVGAYAQAITCPTLVLHGDADRMVPLPWARALAEAIPNARLEVVPSGPHGLIFRSAEVRERTLRFLRSR